METGHAQCIDFSDDAVTAPALLELFRAHINIAFIVCVLGVCGHIRHAQRSLGTANGPNLFGIGFALGCPIRHALQLDAAYNGLHF